MNLFGKSRAKKTENAPKDSVLKLKETLDMLEKREQYLQKKIDNELATAKKNAQSNKKAALMALKRKKTYESQMEKLSGARMTIESQVMAIEGASVSLEAMNAMKQGAGAMKSIHKGMDIDTVDQTMEEIKEQMDLAEEINSAISQPAGFGMDFDEESLAQELSELEGGALTDELGIKEDLPGAKTKGKATADLGALPTAPVDAVGHKGVADEEDELKQLKAAFA